MDSRHHDPSCRIPAAPRDVAALGTVIGALASRIPVFLSNAAFALSARAATGPDGTWTGQWEREGSTLDVEMTFARNASGYTGSFSSAQLRVIGIPLTDVKYEAPRLAWRIVGDQITSSFEGSLHDDTLSGDFREGDASGTFSLVRGSSADAQVQERDVTFRNDAVTLSGTLVSPIGSGPFAGVVFLHASGAEDRSASRYLAHELARRDIVGLIYDKRGVGRSDGVWRTAGFAELVGDATAAVEALRSQSIVDSERVGIYGHGEGAMIVPWVASANPNVAFVAASAAGGVSIAGYDPLEYWRRVTVPVLLLYGEDDERVPPRVSARRIADAYLAAKGPRLDVMFFPLADHDYRWSPATGSDFAWPRTVPEYPQRLIDWIVEASKPCACHIDEAGLDATNSGSQ